MLRVDEKCYNAFLIEKRDEFMQMQIKIVLAGHRHQQPVQAVDHHDARVPGFNISSNLPGKLPGRELGGIDLRHSKRALCNLPRTGMPSPSALFCVVRRTSSKSETRGTVVRVFLPIHTQYEPSGTDSAADKLAIGEEEGKTAFCNSSSEARGLDKGTLWNGACPFF